MYAKRLLCASVLLVVLALAVAFSQRLSVPMAEAQTLPSNVVAVATGNANVFWAVTQAGDIYTCPNPGTGGAWQWQAHLWALGAAPTFVGITCTSGEVVAMEQNGDTWCYEGGAWHLGANVLGGATATRTQSFGALKAKYR